jgi:cytidylate kinase
MMAVVTISREFGSGGDQVAARLCEILGYHAFGKAQILQAAEETTMSMSNAVDYSEDNHEVQTFLTRLFGRTATPVQSIAWSENPSIASQPKRADVHEVAVLSLVKRAIKAALQANNIVIVGRGGQVLLKNTPGVLHVRIIASLEQRTRLVLEQMKREQKAGGTANGLARAAEELIATRDIASADYIRRYYEVDWADPRLYHLILNMSLLNVEQSAQIIVTAVHEMERQASAA